MATFDKSDSFAILESSRRRTGRVLVMMESDDIDDNDLHTDTPRRRKVSAAQPSATLLLHVKLRLARLLLLTGAVSLVTLALVAACRHGLELTRFPAASKSETERSKLLDDYNSYSGTLTAMVGRPLEIFVALLAQIVLLRCAADTMVRRVEPSRRTWLATLALSAAVGYLLNNVLNALNVQLRSLEVRPVISASDISVIGSADALVASVIANNRTNTVSEATARNPLANTVLRNLVLPREAKSPLNCPWRTDATVKPTVVPDDLVEYGIPQRDWQARLLSEAIESQRLRLVVNATNASANAQVRSEDLPMPAARAANLYMNGLLLMGSFLPIDSLSSYFTRRFPNVTIPLNQSSSSIASAAVMAGALPPPSVSADEQRQREWFLNQSQVLLSRVVSFEKSIRQNDLALEFSHVQVAPSIVFDAVTFELETDPALLGQLDPSTNNRTRTATFNRNQCGPWPALCQQPKHEFRFTSDMSHYDPQMQVQAFAVCVDEKGDETLRVSATFMDGDELPPTSVYPDCARTSNSSLLVVSLAKRLTADSLVLQPNGESAKATNLRKLYSLTVGRLAWQLEDLSTVFNATCDTPSKLCLGLQVGLLDAAATPGSSAKVGQRLVVSADALPALPLAYISEPNYRYAYGAGSGKQRSLPLVRVHEPPPSRDKDTREYDLFAGDILFPHNVHDIQWQQTELRKSCKAVIEDRLQLVVKNHLYMEQSLQPAYTAATFFLLQNAVVKDSITLDATALDATRTSLKFDGNQQDIAVRVSVPALNAWLTLAGCALVVLCCLVVVAWPSVLRRRSQPDALRSITSPHAIARVVLDEQRFPPLLLERRVVSAGVTVVNADVSQLRVESVALTQPASASSLRRPTSVVSQL